MSRYQLQRASDLAHNAEIDALTEDLDTLAMLVEQAREAVADGRFAAVRAPLEDLSAIASRCVIPPRTGRHHLMEDET